MTDNTRHDFRGSVDAKAKGYTMDPSFTMPTAKEPPRDPATPRPIDDARRDREQRAEVQRAQDIRAQAVNAAVRLVDMSPEADPLDPEHFWGNVTAIEAYITNGTKP